MKQKFMRSLKYLALAGVLTTLFVGCSDDDDSTSSNTTTGSTTEFTLTSIAIEDGELLDEFKCEDQSIEGHQNSIPLAWSNVPEAANSLAVVMKHYPNESDSTEINSYLLLWDIDPSVTEIPYGTADEGDWYIGANKDGTAISYTSPCSPSPGTHVYIISVFALSATPSSLPDSNSVDVDYDTMINALSTVTIIDEATLTFDDVNG